MLKVITTWHEKYKNEAGDNLVRQRAFKWDEETQEVVNFEDYQEIGRTSLSDFIDRSVSEFKEHNIRKLISFTKKKHKKKDKKHKKDKKDKK